MARNCHQVGAKSTTSSAPRTRHLTSSYRLTRRYIMTYARRMRRSYLVTAGKSFLS